MCEFSGALYCTRCHCNWRATVPAKIVFHWDFTKYRGFCQLCSCTDALILSCLPFSISKLSDCQRLDPAEGRYYQGKDTNVFKERLTHCQMTVLSLTSRLLHDTRLVLFADCLAWNWIWSCVISLTALIQQSDGTMTGSEALYLLCLVIPRFHFFCWTQ